jgi:hypothetical protein
VQITRGGVRIHRNVVDEQIPLSCWRSKYVVFDGILAVLSGPRVSLTLRAGFGSVYCCTVVHGLAYKRHGAVLYYV